MKPTAEIKDGPRGSIYEGVVWLEIKRGEFNTVVYSFKPDEVAPIRDACNKWLEKNENA